MICPMLWCREAFEDPDLTKEHILKCSYLPDTWYWCAYCSRPESFTDCGGTGVKTSQHKMLERKPSKLSKAKAFFRGFGRKSSVKSTTIWPKVQEIEDTSRYASDESKKFMVEEPPNEIDSEKEIHEMERCTKGQCIPPGWELASRLSHTVQHELPQPIGKSLSVVTRIDEHAELYGDFLHNVEADKDSIHAQELDSSEKQSNIASQSREDLLPSWPNTMSSRSRSTISEKQHESKKSMPAGCSESKGSGFSRPRPHHPQPIPWPLPTRSQIFSASNVMPFSDAESYLRSSHDGSSPFSPLSDLSPGGTRQRELQSPSSAWSSNFSRYFSAVLVESDIDVISSDPSSSQRQGCRHQCGNNDVTGTPIAYGHRDEAASSDLNLTQVQLLIQELRELVTIVADEWKQRLSSTPDLLEQCPRLTPNTLVDLGINALQRCFRGTIENAFNDVFALVHVACATAYMLHCDDDLYCWEGFFRDLMEWETTISEEEDMLLFARVMDKLSCPQSLSGDISPTIDFVMECPASGLLQRLRNGRIMKDCSMLLDGKRKIQF